MFGEAVVDELAGAPVSRRRTAFAAGQQRLFSHDGAGDDGAPHPVAVFEVDGAGGADLGTGSAADAPLGRPGEVEVGEPAGGGVGHAQRFDAHFAARRHAEAATDADVAAQAAVGPRHVPSRR